jgi:hypothetical protein
MPLSESQLVAPALIAMYNAGGSIQTTDLIAAIASEFTLDGVDLQPLLNRNDEKYTQIVRNLKSHKKLSGLDYAIEIPGGFRLTQDGEDWLRNNGYI